MIRISSGRQPLRSQPCTHGLEQTVCDVFASTESFARPHLVQDLSAEVSRGMTYALVPVSVGTTCTGFSL